MHILRQRRIFTPHQWVNVAPMHIEVDVGHIGVCMLLNFIVCLKHIDAIRALMLIPVVILIRKLSLFSFITGQSEKFKLA